MKIIESIKLSQIIGGAGDCELMPETTKQIIQELGGGTSVNQNNPIPTSRASKKSGK